MFSVDLRRLFTPRRRGKLRLSLLPCRIHPRKVFAAELKTGSSLTISPDRKTAANLMHIYIYMYSLFFLFLSSFLIVTGAPHPRETKGKPPFCSSFCNGSFAFHCSFMQPRVDRLSPVLYGCSFAYTVTDALEMPVY